MYVPKKKVFEITPPHVLNARGNLFWSAACLGSFCGICMLCVYQYSVNRKREAAAARRLTGPKVVVVGGNVAGANAAASLTQYHPNVQVKVFEPSREQVFYGLVPLAAAGHRSYDLRSSGPNTLYTTCTWTVTRDADLVVAAIDKIDPKENTVIDSNGVRHIYDVLVLACGAQLDFSRIKGMKEENYDRYRVAHTPGTIRDAISTTHQGNVVVCRVPPASEYGHSHPGTSLGMMNTLWKFLDFFGKFRAKTIATTSYVTYNNDICDELPERHNERLREYWEERKINVRTRHALREVNQTKREAWLENLDTKQRVKIPFRLLALDLPMKAPQVIEKNGLSGSGLAGFADVDPETLQHHKFKNIFAIGDCAALKGVPRSYGAIYAQTPVLQHNVTQYLNNCEPNARYDGYSSFPVMMSTWRAMWPEVLGSAHRKLIAARTGSDSIDESKHFGHYWDDSDWVWWKGFAQGFYIQSTAYELMHWLVFTRARWCSPVWWGWKDFADGEPLPASEAPELSNGKHAGEAYSRGALYA